MPDFDSTRSLADARDSCPSQKRSLLDGQLATYLFFVEVVLVFQNQILHQQFPFVCHSNGL